MQSTLRKISPSFGGKTYKLSVSNEYINSRQNEGPLDGSFEIAFLCVEFWSQLVSVHTGLSSTWLFSTYVTLACFWQLLSFKFTLKIISDTWLQILGMLRTYVWSGKKWYLLHSCISQQKVWNIIFRLCGDQRVEKSMSNLASKEAYQASI